MAYRVKRGPARRVRRRVTATAISAAIVSWLALLGARVEAAPAIRLDARNAVPQCVTPARLMAFLAERNQNLDPRFREIAHWYRHFGEAWRVRWDYAFFQMTVETNYLKFHRADGKRGDVDPRQNNFAGIGTTGGGVPGDRFPDVKTGVHAQIQHLVAYSGERLAAPIAPRTQSKQGIIIEQSLRLGRPVTFADLASRWAVDRNYARTIEYVANQYRSRYCAEAAVEQPPAPRPARRDLYLRYAPPSGLGGPKPSKLAGPETETEQQAEMLPWGTLAEPPEVDGPSLPTAAPVPAPPPAAKPTTVHAPAPAHRSPVRTIWSRGDKSVKPSTGTSEPLVAVNRRDAGSFTPTSAPDEQASLPLFRIAPVTMEPSRLGGPPPDTLAAKSSEVAPCRVMSASFGGSKTLLLKANVDGETRLTALTVLDGFERSMVDTYSRANGIKAELVGEYPSQEQALVDAEANCMAKR